MIKLAISLGTVIALGFWGMSEIRDHDQICTAKYSDVVEQMVTVGTWIERGIEYIEYQNHDQD